MRKVRQDDLSGSTRSRSRFRSRSRLPSRGSSSFRTTTTTSRPPLRSRFRPKSRKVNSGSGSRFSSNSGRFGSSSSFNSDFDYDYDYDYDNTDLQSSQSSVPTVITVTHTVPLRTVIPVRENGRETFKEVITTSPSLQVIQATDLKSTNIDGSPVIYANTKTATPAPGTKVVTFEALRATETTTVTFTPTRIRGLRTKASAVVPSTIYNIKPVTTSSVTPVDNNQLLTQLLLQLLGNQQTPLTNTQPQPAAVPQLNQLLPNLGISPSPPQTQFITHTSTYVTTVTNVKSTVLPITLRGREIKTTLVESSTEVATVTELSTETIQPAPTQAALPILPTAAAAPSPAAAAAPGGLQLGDLQQQLLAAQLQAQLKQQQQQLLNQQLLSQLNLGGPSAEALADVLAPSVAAVEPAAAEAAGPVTSVVTVFVSGKNPGEFSKVTSTVTLEPGEEFKRYKRDIQPSKVQPVLMTRAPESSSGLTSPNLQQDRILLQSSVQKRDTSMPSLGDMGRQEIIQSSLSDY